MPVGNRSRRRPGGQIRNHRGGTFRVSRAEGSRGGAAASVSTDVHILRKPPLPSPPLIFPSSQFNPSQRSLTHPCVPSLYPRWSRSAPSLQKGNQLRRSSTGNGRTTRCLPELRGAWAASVVMFAMCGCHPVHAGSFGEINGTCWGGRGKGERNKSEVFLPRGITKSLITQ